MLTPLSLLPPAENQARAAGLAAEGFVSPGAVGSAAGQHQTSDPAAAVAGLGADPGQRVSGGPGEGARDPEPAAAAPEVGRLGPRGAGEEAGDHGLTAGQRHAGRRARERGGGAAASSSSSGASVWRCQHESDCCCFASFFRIAYRCCLLANQNSVDPPVPSQR